MIGVRFYTLKGQKIGMQININFIPFEGMKIEHSQVDRVLTVRNCVLFTDDHKTYWKVTVQ